MFRTPLKTFGFLAIALGVFLIAVTSGRFLFAGVFFIVQGLLLYLADYLVTRFAKKRSVWIALQIIIALLYLSAIIWLANDIGLLDSKVIN